MKARFGVVLLMCLFSALGAWTYEQIEPAGNWAWVETEVMPTGMICACCRDSVTGHVCVDRRDSIWHRDDLGIWRSVVGHHLTIGPRQKPAVLLESDTVTEYATLTDTGWDFTVVNCTTDYPYTTGSSFLAFDSSGAPSLAYCFPVHQMLSSKLLKDGVWITDTIEQAYDDGYFGWWPTPPTTFVLGPHNRFYNDRGLHGIYQDDPTYQFVDAGRTGAWSHLFSAGDLVTEIKSISMALGPDADFAVCYDMRNFFGPDDFYCNHEVIESLPAASGRVRIDINGIRQIVYRLGVMKYAHKDVSWHIDTLPSAINDASSFDFAIDRDNRPVIAFSHSSGVFLATGAALAISEDRSPEVGNAPKASTIVRGLLCLPPAPSSKPQAEGCLLDISGRKVLNLKPGPNDVSRLAPGVYFMREQPQATSFKPQAVRKVILTR